MNTVEDIESDKTTTGLSSDQNQASTPTEPCESSDTVQESTSPAISPTEQSLEQQQQQHGDQQPESLLLSNTISRPSSNTMRHLTNFAMTASAAAVAATAATTSSISSNIFLNSSSSSPPPLSASTSYPTLARSQYTPYWAKLSLPILCVACQILFYYGQTEPMWKLHANATIDVWANATAITARRTFDVLGLDYDIPIKVNEPKDVQTFTYMFAIKELWEAKNLPGTLLPRTAAILLIIFSGLWPHLKLMMLNLTWFFGKHKTRRTKILSWLASLGKWSLADVLVVCVMVGVLNLDWIVDPGAIKDGVINDLPSILQIVESLYTSEQVCSNLLEMDCPTQKRVAKIAKCKACKGLVSEAFGHPEWARSTGKKILDGVSTNGEGIATLRVVGMKGIYYFCGAVILSIFLSLAVDILDHRAKLYEQKREEEERGVDGYRERGGLLFGERPVRHLTVASDNNNSNDFDILHDDGRLDIPLLSDGGSTVSAATSSFEIELPEGVGDEIIPPSNLSNNNNGNMKLFSMWFLIASLLCIICVYLAAEMYTMERLVYGAGPQLLNNILGVDWERPYSFRTLMWTTGAAGGWDYMLMGTFGLFCVVGPVVRAVLLFFTVILDQCNVASISNLAVIVNFLGSFCAWEVFAIATVMVQMLMPSITDTIIRNPVCGKISDDGSCLKIEFNLIPIAFSTVLIGGFSLVGLSWVASGRAIDKGETTPNYNSARTGNGNSIGENLTRVMTPNHDYERIEIEEGTMDSIGGGRGDELEELVFETNQV